MENISSLLSRTIERVMSKKGYRTVLTPNSKMLVLDDDFNVKYKLDIAFNNNDFNCILLTSRNSNLREERAFVVPWTSGEKIRGFLQYLKDLK